jgi:hypothetical protein
VHVHVFAEEALDRLDHARMARQLGERIAVQALSCRNLIFLQGVTDPCLRCLLTPTGDEPEEYPLEWGFLVLMCLAVRPSWYSLTLLVNGGAAATRNMAIDII